MYRTQCYSHRVAPLVFVLPAHAGVIPDNQGTLKADNRITRTCGGDPQFVVMDKLREKIKQELSKPKPQYTRKNIDIVRYILEKHDLKSEGNRNSALNKALFIAQKMGATSSEIEEIASHSTLPDSEKGYMIRRYTK